LIEQIEIQTDASLIISFLVLVVPAATFVLRLQDRRTDLVVDATYGERHIYLVMRAISDGQE
jgi:hypothetical protein